MGSGGGSCPRFGQEHVASAEVSMEAIVAGVSELK